MTDQLPDTLRCEICGQNIYADEGKDPQAVLRGHQIRCKMLHRQQEEAKMKEGEVVMEEQVQQEAVREEPKEVKRPDIPKRKERVPFGVPAQRLPHGSDPNFVYRVFNDQWAREPGRIQRAQAAGYEVVEGQEAITVGTNEDGSAIKGVLMRIPKEWYQEDQKVKQKEIDKATEQIYRGKFQEKAEDKRYIPSSGIQIETKLTP